MQIHVRHRVARALVATVVLALGAALAGPASAATIIYRTDGELVALAARVVHARVLKQRTERPDPNGVIFTVTTMAVLEDFTAVTGDTVEVWELGGSYGDEAMFVGGQVVYGPGEEVVVCLERGPHGLRSVAMGFSRFSVAPTGVVGGLPDGRLTRAMADVNLAGGALRGAERTLAQFRELTEQVRGVRSIRNRSAELMLLGEGAEAGFTFLGPFRWFEADSGTAITVYQNSNAPNPLVSGDAVAEIQSSLAGWTNPVSASIILQYGGSTNQSAPTGPFTVPSPAIVISWEDPQGNISGSTLAVGGGFASGSTGTVNGTVFNRFIRGYVLFQNAADLSPSFRQSTNFSRVVEHEIGHTIGLGHSADSANIMFASCCSASAPIPPAIGSDDLDGITFIYPSGGTPPPPAGCSFTVAPTSALAAAAGGTATVSVTTTASCSWTAASNDTSVLTVVAGATSTGSGTATYSVAANSSPSQRTATLTVAGQTVTITQAGVAAPTCVYVVSPLAPTFGTAAGTGSISVSAAAGCTWTALSNSSFITVTSGATGSGAGTVGFSVAANTAVSQQRFGTMTIAGQTVTVAQDGTGPIMSLDKSSLIFGATTTTVASAFVARTSNQTIRIAQAGIGTVTWTAAASQPWITVSPASGSGAATLTIGVQNAAGVPASATIGGTVTLTFTGAGRGAGPIAITLRTMLAGASGAPFGSFDGPVEGATGITGSIGVTGWALDDVEVSRVQIYRDPVAGEAGLVFIGDAVVIDGARPDVAAGNPGLPLNTRSGWGYLLLTNFLPNFGNGTFRLQAFAVDREGRASLLGTKTITCANDKAVKPFGAIDTPAQGEVVSGAAYANFGWVLSRTPALAYPPFGIVSVVIDGTFFPSPVGWTSRADLTALFPAATYPGVTNALGVSTINTTTLTNGLHTIAWVVTANNNQADGIGSRYFTVNNAGGGIEGDVAAASSAVGTGNALMMPDRIASARSLSDEVRAASADRRAIDGRRGFVADAPFQVFETSTIRSEELDRLELRLGSDVDGGSYTGYLRAAGELGPLPVGSHLDRQTGVFTWLPGVGFLRGYDFVFVRWSGGRAVARQELRIVIEARNRSRVGPQVAIDAPGAGDLVQPFAVAGWAIDPDAAAGTGVDALHVWAYPVSRTSDPLFLGATVYGGSRPDVAAIFGDRFLGSGYGLTVDSLLPGTYDLAVFAWSTATGGFVPARVVRVTVRN